MKRNSSTDARIQRAVALNAMLGSLALAPYDAADDGVFKHDKIVSANASLFTEAFFSEPLTSYAVGWKDPNDIEATLGFFAPEVLVPRRFEYAEATNAEEFYSDGDDDERPLRGDFPAVEYTSAKSNAKTVNRGLKICVDLDEVADQENWRQAKTAKLIRRLRRNSLRRAIALLSAAATNTAKTWDVTAGKDPDQDILGEIITATTASGIRPSRVGYGDTAFSKRQLAHRAQNNAGGFASAAMNMEQLAAFLGVDKALVSKERYSTGGAKAEILSNLVLMFNASDGMDTEDASNIKRFVSLCEGGERVRVFERQISAKLWEIVVENYELTKITSTLGIRKETIS